MKPIHVAAVSLALSACQGASPPPAESSAAAAPETQAVSQPISAGRHDRRGATFTRTDLASDQAGAQNLDPTLVNAWGLAFNPAGVAWISANGSGIAEIYNSEGGILAPPVTVPPPAGSTATAAPTGQIFNSDPRAFGGDVFIVATEDGTISGWQTKAGASFALRIDNSASGTVYKGIAQASAGGALRLFAADFHNGKIDVFDDAYQPVHLKGRFEDRDLPAGFAPFNVQEAQGALIITYALQDAEAHDDVAGPGNGFVDLFDTDGHLLRRLASHGGLNSPWGIAMTPMDFGSLSNRLLIGNFGDGRINIFRLDGCDDDDNAPAEAEGTLRDERDHTLRIDGLWALSFGVGTGGFERQALYFTAGPGGEAHGVFGRLDMTGLKHAWP